MDVTRFAERLMAMDEVSWQRYSNPLRVYGRFTILPLKSLVFWF